jgi:hypothetical protein
MDLIIKPKSWLNTDLIVNFPKKGKKIKPTMSRIGKQPVVVPLA